MAIRGIIFINDKLLMIEDSYLECKLPGGGKENNESDLETLAREVKEETGYSIILDSVKPFLEIEEKRLSIKEEKTIWHQINRIYFARVNSKQEETSYTDNEKKLGFKCVLLTLDEAIEKNRYMLLKEGEKPFNQREYITLNILKEKLNIFL